MSDRSTEHATFTIERKYGAPPSRVFAAWADAEAKSRWFGPPRKPEGPGIELDFRVGGREHFAAGPPGGPLYTYDAVFMRHRPRAADRLHLRDAPRRPADLGLGGDGRTDRD